MLFEKDLEVLCTNRSLFSAERMQEFKTVAEFLFDFVRFIDGEQRMAFTADRLLDLVCQEECNSFGLYSFLPDSPVGEPKYAFGLAIYPQAVYFNHSCAPNVVHHTIGKRQVFYAVRDIAEGMFLYNRRHFTTFENACTAETP
jgi:hypothetical protein